MKKIYLIDDNSKNQRELYGASFVDNETYTDYLCHVEKLNAQSDLSFLNQAVCVMLHDSLEDSINGDFISSSHKAKERIEEIIQDRGIPYVLFSDGHPMTADWREDTPNIVYSIKKSEFYRHLNDFMNNYVSTGNIDLRIIAYGKEFMKHLISKWCQSIISNLADTSEGEDISVSKIDKRSLRLIIENSQPKIGVTFDEIMCGIEDGEINACNLRNNINNIISSVKKYGKNISSWK